MKRYYHEFKIMVGNGEYDTMIDIDLLSIESVEISPYKTDSNFGEMALLHTDSGMHLHVYNTKKEVMEIINSVNE